MSSYDLFDLKHFGNFLSWRGRRHTHMVRCRLDRVMANSDWIIAYPSDRSEYLRFEGSDHRPLVTSLEPLQKKRKTLFRYDRNLKDNPEIRELVTNTWRYNPSVSVDHRIQLCRDAIISWSKTHHLNSQKEIRSLRDELETSLSSNSASQTNIDDLNQRLLIAYQTEEAYWKQHSRQLWLKLGDRNSGYFHAATKGRRALNNISVIEFSSGTSVYEEHEILKTISDYFQDIFTSKEGDRSSVANEALSPCISVDMNAQLVRMPNVSEIKQACFSASFCQSNWNSVGDEIIAEIQTFFITGILLARINHTHVRLTPKVPCP